MATWTQKSPWRRIAITVTSMAVVLLMVASFRFVQSRGYFASVEEKVPGMCRTVAGVAGVTGLAPDAHTATVFIASRLGGIYVWHDGGLVKMSGTPKDFRPVALAVSHPQNAEAKLQVVFAREGGGYSVAVFDIQPGALTEIGRLTADTLTDPADLAAADGGRFYLVNRHKSHTALGRWLDDVFLLPRAEVLYFDGMKFVAVAGRLNSPGGVVMAPDGSHLYVAQELPRSLASFTRSYFTGALDNAALLSLPAAPRKITVAPNGSLIVAASPKRGTGAVYRVRLDSGVPVAAELLYSTRSEEITAAAEASGHLLIGSQKALIDCRL